MDYLTLVVITQILALFFFFALFAGVLAYVLWPGNKSKFERAAQLPFDTGEPTLHKSKS